MCIAPTSDQVSTTTTPSSSTSSNPAHDFTNKKCEPGSPAVIDRLNAQTRKWAKESTLTPADADYDCFDLVNQGNPVFKHRWFFLLYLYWTVTAWGIITGPSLAFTTIAFIVMYLYIEFFGAVLHVVLDNPKNLKTPLLWEACLEFQWHHFVPHEIFVRSYAQIAADLNLIVGLHFAVNMLIYGGLGDPRIRALICTAMANAYLLQFAHRQAHMVSSSRHPIAKFLQSMHLLVTPEMHRAHHRTYDTGFPVLSGLSDPLINWMNKRITNRWFWIILFVSMTLGGLTTIISLFLPAYEALQAVAAPYGLAL